MSSVFVLTANTRAGWSDDLEEAAFLPLDPGNYVVLVKGTVALPVGNIYFRLDVGGAGDHHPATDQTTFIHQAPPDYADAFAAGTFGLAVAANIAQAVTPLDHGASQGEWAGGDPEPQAAGAWLFVKKVSPRGGQVINVRIIAFQVDSISAVESG